MVIIVLFKLNTNNSLITFGLIIALMFYLFSILCGFILLKNRYNEATSLSIINQLFQVISFANGTITYKFVSGFGITIILGGSDTTGKIKFNITNFLIEFGESATTEAFFGINVIAILIIAILLPRKFRNR